MFCVNHYAFGILKPLADELQREGHQTLWYVGKKLADTFPFQGVQHTNSIRVLIDYKSDAVFVPGNEVPHFIRGVKVQVFHGLAGEKKGHFRIRTYFDLYLTQGPYFTKRFKELADKHNDFEVQETGWCKLDPLFEGVTEARLERDRILLEKKRRHLVLYAPTFSPSLTSAINCQHSIYALTSNPDVYLLIKFHDLMDAGLVKQYRTFASTQPNVEIVEDRNILRVLKMADLMISDTSSVVYEFVLLDRPVITIDSISENINWLNISEKDNLPEAVMHELQHDTFSNTRKEIVRNYHPYADGKSSYRMIRVVEDYILRNGVPEFRKLGFFRRYKMNKMFPFRK